jgi:hypothetical protein
MNLDLDKPTRAMLQEMGKPFGERRAYGGSSPLPQLIPGVGAQSGCAVATVRTG